MNYLIRATEGVYNGKHGFEIVSFLKGTEREAARLGVESSLSLIEEVSSDILKEKAIDSCGLFYPEAYRMEKENNIQYELEQIRDDVDLTEEDLEEFSFSELVEKFGINKAFT